jgi:peroxiredoxin family protein
MGGQAEGIRVKHFGDNKLTMIVFDGDLDKAIASFIIANGAAAFGKEVVMFFTFWGLNILRKPEGAKVKKNLIEKIQELINGIGLVKDITMKKLKKSCRLLIVKRRMV